MEQLVKVRSLNPDGSATVIHVRQSACSGDCHKCSGCGAAEEALLFQADNPIGAKPGDLVRVTSESAPVLKGAAVLYVQPLVLFFAGYFLGEALSLSGPLFAGLGFGLGVALAVVYDRKVLRHRQTRYTITAFGPEHREEDDHG